MTSVSYHTEQNLVPTTLAKTSVTAVKRTSDLKVGGEQCTKVIKKRSEYIQQE